MVSSDIYGLTLKRMHWHLGTIKYRPSRGTWRDASVCMVA